MAFEWGIAITPDGTTAYVVNEGIDSVTPIDLASGAAESPISLSGHNFPHDIAITPDGQTAYVTIATGTGTVIPINLATGTPGTPITFGGGYSSNGIAISPDGTMAYVTNFNGNSVTPINLATGTPGTAITGGGMNGPWNIAITPDGKTAYVTNVNGTSVTPINLATDTPGAPITGGGIQNPGDIAITPDGQTAYVTNEGGNSVTPINLATGTPGTPITGGGMDEPMGIAIATTQPPAPVVNSVTPSSGSTVGGESVTITGTNLASAESVTIGGNSATISSDSASSITVTTPPGNAGPADVVVTTIGGSVTDAQAFTYVAASITDVVFQGTEASPTIVINGTGFETEAALGPANPPGCSNLSPTGNDFGDNLWIQDWTANWLAGRGQACVGLNVVSYSDTQIVLTPGSLYSSYGFFPGDSFTMNVLDASFAGTVAYLPSVTQVMPSFGPTVGGNTVTVNGTNFVSGQTTVDFGTAAGTSVSVTSSTSLTVVVPSGSGTVSVTVSTTSAGSSTPLANAYTYGPAGGTVTLSRTAALIGNYPEKVSGTGWQAHGDTSVTINECASTVYSAATCDASNQATATLGTGLHLGTFSNAVIKLAVGGIVAHGNTCGVAGSGPCYIVVVGNTGDESTSAALGFTLPSFSLHKTTGVLGNYVDAVVASGVPIGDTVIAGECDLGGIQPLDAGTSVTISTHCDASTVISGTAATNGKVVFSPLGVTLRVGSAYSDTFGGTCNVGSMCAVGVNDTDNADVAAGFLVTFATPTIKVAKTTGVLGNYVEKVTALDFPIGDTIDAVECDSSATTANLGQRCDDATQISGVASAGVYPQAAGEVTGTDWSPLGLTMLVGAAYSDGAAGSCLTGGSCYVAAIDSTNPSVNALTGSLAMATPSVTITPTTVLNGNGKTITMSAKGFPIGDTVDAVECDTAFSGNLNNCDTAKTQISGTAGATGAVLWPPTTPKVPVLTTATSTPYADSSSPPATCAPGDSVANNDPCFVYTYDASNSAITNTSPFGVS
jgi:DNA-binding beta-propeller fold protein YncE